ncbi:MAG: 30S ribosomal protein S1 [Bacteroidales bacterium]|nr:30S ribosomal protein S1 [Bacteroidales bacterium]
MSEENKAEEQNTENQEQQEAAKQQEEAKTEESQQPVDEKTEEEQKPEEQEKAADKDESQEHIPETPQFATPQQEFDWDAADEDIDDYDKERREKLENVYDQTLSTIDDQEVIDGTIVAMNNREVVVNIGYKSDGLISMNELRYRDDLQIGDTVEVYVENKEDSNGQLVLSHRKARVLRSWERVIEAHDKDEIINGHIKCRTKGGLIVDVFGLEAFLPGSQIDVKPIRDYDQYVGKNMEFKVVKINHEFKNVVVSHKALIQDELEKQKAEIISKLEKGQILEGTVKNITSYGVFIDLGGVDGLIHITDLSWGRINHPEEIVELDQKLNVVILDFDDDKKRIALGLKQLQPHPWESLDENLKVGDKVKGKVVVVADYGAFVEIAPGVEGLIHVSEMSWSQHLRTAHDFLKVGDEVEAVILTLDREDRKMSLGMKQLMPDPWENIESKYPVGSKHTATVRNFTNFGIFVELEEGVDGLIHISDLSWSKKIKHPAEFTQIGDSIEVVVLELDKENRRLSLGHKQLEENPWDVFETIFTDGSIHKGTVESIVDKGAIITLPYGVEGFAPMKHLKKEDGSNVKKDETLDFKVIEFNKKSKKIVVSHSRIYEDKLADEKADEKAANKAKAKATAKEVKNLNEGAEKATLGDLGVLANLKNELQAEEKVKAQDYMKKRSEKDEEQEEQKGEAEEGAKKSDEQNESQESDVSLSNEAKEEAEDKSKEIAPEEARSKVKEAEEKAEEEEKEEKEEKEEDATKNESEDASETDQKEDSSEEDSKKEE